MIDAFSNLILSVSDGNTVPSTDISGNKTFIDIGCGSVCKLYWTTPTTSENQVDYYSISIKARNVSEQIEIYDKQPIGYVNDFYITSELLSSIPYTKYTLSVSVTANSIHGIEYNLTSEPISVCISKGCGCYIEVSDGYAQPIMKRAIAFSKLDYLALEDADGKVLLSKAGKQSGKQLYAKSAAVQDNTVGWALMQECFVKDSDGGWHKSDLLYEVLTDINGEIITDSNNEPIYIL